MLFKDFSLYRLTSKHVCEKRASHLEHVVVAAVAVVAVAVVAVAAALWLLWLSWLLSLLSKSNNLQYIIRFYTSYPRTIMSWSFQPRSSG